MKLKIDNEEIIAIQNENINEKSINIYEIEFEFSEEWDELNKKLIITRSGQTEEIEIIDNKVIIPSLKSGTYYLGVVGYIIENEVIVKRKTTNIIPKKIEAAAARYEANAETEEEHASVLEQKIAELQDTLQETEEAVSDFNDDVTSKTQTFNENAQSKLTEYNDNATSRTQLYNENAQSKVTEYNDNSTFKTQTFNENAQNKLAEYNQNAENKLTAYNNNATSKTEAFNQNAEEKKRELLVELTDYSKIDETGSKISLNIDNQTFKIKAILKDKNFNVIAESNEIDLPLESVVVNGRYDKTTKKVILTLENGSEVDFSVADLVAGLQTEINANNKLNSEYVDDTNSANKFVTMNEKNTWNAKADKTYVDELVGDIASILDSINGEVVV